jgi:hypothetical protein
MEATLNSALSGFLFGSFCVRRAGGATSGVTSTRRSGTMRRSETRRTGDEEFASGIANNASKI